MKLNEALKSVEKYRDDERSSKTLITIKGDILNINRKGKISTAEGFNSLHKSDLKKAYEGEPFEGYENAKHELVLSPKYSDKKIVAALEKIKKDKAFNRKYTL